MLHSVAIHRLYIRLIKPFIEGQDIKLGLKYTQWMRAVTQGLMSAGHLVHFASPSLITS